jgi:hypothetical protein
MKTKTNKNTNAFLISSIASYAILKIANNKIAPYTRTVCGVGIGVTSLLFSGYDKSIAYISSGIIAGSGLQVIDAAQDGKLTYNKSPGPIFILSEHLGVMQLIPNQVPNYAIDGIAVPGTGKVFKVSNGVYAGINANGSIYTYGVGSIVNIIAKAGYMPKAWVQQQTDQRWQELYNSSL